MASSLTNKQKQEYARSLFLHENLTQQEIADRVNVSRKTIGEWIKKGNWESFRVSIMMTKEEQLKNLYNQLSELNRTITERKENRFATPSEADTISKLANAIEKMEGDVGIADIIAVIKKLTAFIRKISLQMAKDLMPVLDGFIKDNLR
ncbi:DUF1804 family protein [Parabacteroides sp. OttesenSCG-928-K15]|nr:DUF1804 family protein [Parabacteroides sp. OttesenSCG-928-K15]